jgi:NAD(P)-dependent dehydrogenase (short-subunit alcohol dehydrogenase family)
MSNATKDPNPKPASALTVDLNGRVIVITGGSEGIGKGIAHAVVKCGGKAAIVSRDEDDLREVVDAIESSGGDAMYAVADVTDGDQLNDAMNRVAKQYGQIDGLVANAGTNGTWAPVDELTPDEWRKTIDVNLTGTYLTIHHGLPHLRKRGRGSIVIMSSINGTRTFTNTGASAYATSKAGQLALGKMLALELAGSKIRVNVICPGGIHSNIHDKTEREQLDRISTPAEYPDGAIPLTHGEMGDPEDIANMTAFLLSDLASHITGTPIWIDGGQSLLQ